MDQQRLADIIDRTTKTRELADDHIEERIKAGWTMMASVFDVMLTEMIKTNVYLAMMVEEMEDKGAI